ncbi:MAG: TolC family protein [Pyrinomonadaceae bacterium]|nr:TolC family protein [Pyrinomonadaceae bacterium]
MYLSRRFCAFATAVCLLLLLQNVRDGFAAKVSAQEISNENKEKPPEQVALTSIETAVSDEPTIENSAVAKPILVSVMPQFYDSQNGLSANDLIERALRDNLELQAAWLDVDKARARLLQARQSPNPTVEFEQSSGRVLGSPGGGQFTIGASIPIEIYGRRKRRVTVAQIEIEASEALIRNRERQLTSSVLTNYADALAAMRELEATENLLELDLQTTRFVQIRVNEGETAPLELNLLQAEVERLRAQRELAAGKLASALTQLTFLAGLDFNQPLRLREQITNAVLPQVPATRETAFEVALRTRPDVQLAQIEEQVATAGLRLVRAGSRPDLTVFSRYTQGRLGFDNLAETRFPSFDRTLSFGVAINLPVFNRQQGAVAENEIAIKQAQKRREFAERVVRGEVTAAFQRLEASNRAVSTLETGALPRSNENVAVFRKVYGLGETKITDLIMEQRRLLDVNRDLTEALTERYRAQADLQIALGASFVAPK